MTQFKFRSKIARDIFNNKYRHPGAETWPELARTLVTHVMGAVCTKEEQDQILAAGFDAPLIKPINKAILLETLSSL